MEDIELVIKIPDKIYETIKSDKYGVHQGRIYDIIRNGKVIPKEHGRLGDLDELEQRISRFVERDASITDEYTVARQRFIVDGIRETPTIIKADGGAE